MLNAPWLGLCVIVKNAEKTIQTLLKSIDGVFDEVVIVDTGSTDGTKQIVQDHYGLGPRDWNGGDLGVNTAGSRPVQRLVFASFDWVNDFSAARQFSFELGTAKWRMRLDADDRVEFRHLRRMLGDTEKNSPSTNCVSLKYDYVRDEVAQDAVYLVRWADGWRFEDPVHEHLVPIGHPRIISKYEDVWIRHEPNDPMHGTHSFERNLKIVEKAYLQAKTPEKRALWAYHLANHAHEMGAQKPELYDVARKYYREVGNGLGRTNITCDGLVKWARMEMKLGNHEKAIDIAAEAIGKAPEMSDGLATLGVAQLLAGAPYRAAGIFDVMGAMSKPVLETAHDAVWIDGIVNARAAQAYYRTGRVADAQLALRRIPSPLIRHPEVLEIVRPISQSLQKTDGFERLKALWEFLIWDTEPLKAKQLLEDFCPAALSDSPQVKELLRQMEPKLAHMKDWGAYQRAYAGIPDDPYHVPASMRTWTLTQGRARALRQWAEHLPKEGPALEVLVIGIQDGIIEGAMLEACSRINLTACDVAPQASRGINELIERFPGRVKTHQVKKDHFDWFPSVQSPEFKTYDAVVIFEVLEHLPGAWEHDVDGDQWALEKIRCHLKPDGKLFLSTPIAASWVESYLSDLKSPRPWWHVRAHNPTSLWELFQAAGFTGSLVGLGGEELFLAIMTPARIPPYRKDIAIYLYPLRPMTEGIDPFSPKLGHVGGSEEAAIHLSTALARKGHQVTLYSDMPVRRDKLFVHEGVQWRTHDQLDVPSLKGTLLVWRAPQLAAHFKKLNPRVKVLNWLHDTHYDAKPETYDAVDGTVVLSRFHAAAVSKLDGYSGSGFLFASNGIVPSEFPEPDESKRVPHSAIYAAAPERGLELLLEAWPMIRAAVPDATLRVYYSWELTEKMLEKRPVPELSALLKKLRGMFDDLHDQGVEYIGGVDHKTLNEAYRTSALWTFPPEKFEEIFCISALRAQASGCWPVIIPTGALPETCPHGTHVAVGSDARTYATQVIYDMLHSKSLPVRKEMREWALAQSWDKTADQFIEAITTKSNRVTIFAGGFGRQFDHAGSGDGLPLGGSEQAVIEMADALAHEGKDVVVYAPLPGGRDVHPSLESRHPNATWLDASTFDPAGPHGTLLAWRCPALVPKLKGNGYPVILWLMDPQYQAQPCDYAEADDVAFLTESHRQIIERKDGYDGGGSVVPIGLPELPLLGYSARDPKAVMWATSPDRGLLEFLCGTWDDVVSLVPDAVLHIFYGLEPLERAGKTVLATNIRAAIKGFGKNVVYHGGVPDSELYDWYQRCGTFAYRAVGFEETQSLSLIKAQALGCFPVVNDTGCLGEVVRQCGGLVVPDERYTEALISTIKGTTEVHVREDMIVRARKDFSVEAMATKMLKAIERVLR